MALPVLFEASSFKPFHMNAGPIKLSSVERMMDTSHKYAENLKID